MDNIEKALQILIDAEIKETDFKNEAIYNTIVGNFKKCFDNVDKLNNAIYEKNTLIFDLQNQIQRRDIMVSDLDEQITELKSENEKMKEALFQRNTMIQDLDQEVQELEDKVEDLESDLHLTEAQLRSKKIDIEFLKDRVSVLEKILLPHQELTQWVEEEIDNIDKNELLNFIQKLYDKVHEINH